MVDVCYNLAEIACWRGTQLACQDAITHMIACGHAISSKNADAAGTRETITCRPHVLLSELCIAPFKAIHKLAHQEFVQS